MKHETRYNGELLLVIYSGEWPFEVVTTKGHYDFDWCERDQTLYWTDVGGGSSDRVHIPRTTSGGRIWVAEDVETYTWKGRLADGSLRDVSCDPAAMGYEVLDELPADPFELDEALSTRGGGCYWCTACEDHLPEDDLCEHMWWCGTCGLVGGSCPDAECRCRLDVEGLLDAYADDFVPWLVTGNEAARVRSWVTGPACGTTGDGKVKEGVVLSFRHDDETGEVTIWSDGTVETKDAEFPSGDEIENWLRERNMLRDLQENGT